jgi:hypothetical protein
MSAFEFGGLVFASKTRCATGASVVRMPSRFDIKTPIDEAAKLIAT